jgi:hypothetical protein
METTMTIDTTPTPPAPHLSMRDWFLLVLDERARAHVAEARRNDSEEKRP